jgi:predicted ribosome quality control (RQC) complex YloA/Tae2 family protein
MFYLIKDFVFSIFGKGNINKLLTWAILAMVIIISLLVWKNYDNILTTFGFETKNSLKNKVEQQEQVIDTLKDTNENLSDTIQKQEESNKATTETIVEYYDKIEEEKKSFDSLEERTLELLRDLNDIDRDSVIIELIDEAEITAEEASKLAVEPANEIEIKKEAKKEIKLVPKKAPKVVKKVSNPKPKKVTKIIKINKVKADLVSQQNIDTIWDAFCMTTSCTA